MNFLWTSYEPLMIFIWTSYELLKRLMNFLSFLWTSYKLITNFSYTYHKRLIYLSQTSYRRLKNFSQTSHKLPTIFLQPLFGYMSVISKMIHTFLVDFCSQGTQTSRMNASLSRDILLIPAQVTTTRVIIQGMSCPFYHLKASKASNKKFPTVNLKVQNIGRLNSKIWPYFIEYSVHFFTFKMMLKYSLRTIHGR